MMRERGILVVPGTDMGGSFAYHRELELFERAGYTAPEVLRLATLGMAEYLDQDEDLGSIEGGKYADFFLIPGDPTQDLGAIKSTTGAITVFASALGPVTVGLMLDNGFSMEAVCVAFAAYCILATPPLIMALKRPRRRLGAAAQ